MPAFREHVAQVDMEAATGTPRECPRPCGLASTKCHRLEARGPTPQHGWGCVPLKALGAAPSLPYLAPAVSAILGIP